MKLLFVLLKYKYFKSVLLFQHSVQFLKFPQAKLNANAININEIVESFI